MSKSKQKLRVIPLGGLQETERTWFIEYGDEMLVVDCGLSFPRLTLLGEPVIPDISYLANTEKDPGRHPDTRP